MSLEQDAYRYAIRNAFDHNGKADMGALVGKLKALYPDSNPKDLIPLAKATVQKVNNLGMNDIRAEYETFEKQGFELKIPEKKVGLLDLDWAAHEPVVTRWAPNPSAPPHLGHLRAALLSYLYAQKYGGKFILRFDDTDPKLKKPMEKGEELYLQNLQWFGIVPDLVARASDRLDVYYDYMTQLVEMGQAYICTCEKEAWKAGIKARTGCECRALDTHAQRARLKKFLTHEYKQGEALLRIKTDLNAEDPSQIDWFVARIVDKPQHYRVKDKHVWPSYNFASAIDDHLMGVTLIIRGQEHYQNMLKQQWLYQHFGWTYPHAFHYGRILIKGTELSKSKMLLGIQTGKYTGWDDPRLYTIQALQRKGFNPQAFFHLMIELGVKSSDTTVDLQLLATFNKPYVEKSPQIPFIQDPLHLDVDFVPAMEVKLDARTYSLKAGNQAFYVSKHDAQKWSVNSTLRLRNAYVVKLNHVEAFKLNAQFVSTAKLENTTQTNWLPGGVDVRITMPTGEMVFGLAEEGMARLDVDEEVFFPGFGYCRVDEKTEREIRLWFTHP